MNHAVVDLTTNAVVAVTGSLPFKHELAPKTVVSFTKAGDVAPDAAAPTHKLVPVVITNPASTGETVSSFSDAFDGTQVNRTNVLATDLPGIKDKLKSQLNEDAETVRLKYITPGEGMAMTYQEKFAEANAVNDLGEVAANALTAEEQFSAFPVLAASVGIEAPTLWDCAQGVINAYTTFSQVAHVIEKTRLAGKASIDAAANAQDATAAYEAVTWAV